MPKLGGWRGSVAGLIAAGVAVFCTAAWAQLDVPAPNNYPSTTKDATRDGEAVNVPTYPKEDDLVGFFVSAANDFKFFIDRKSLSIGSDGVVRYTLIARSPEGVDNVSYEGIRCSAESYRIYATGHADRRWSKRATEWRKIEPKTVARWRQALLRDYFCPAGAPIFTVADGIDGLERGRNAFIDKSGDF